ncbi:unnamed protein product [Angiostrongylus costaricensis]|uniref:CLASP_N domain-containing protein n=1 Tax=Angiostrongylus costaricensis TaxID=334426 RepID=A0A0R3PJA4_ANGCS|nr:unnamed protein product [Angiostrongylus costaricensis]
MACIAESLNTLMYSAVTSKDSITYALLGEVLRRCSRNIWLFVSREELEAQTNHLIPTFCKLMSDPHADVREAAIGTLAHTMLIYGDDVCNNIRNRRLIPENKMQLLTQQYENDLRLSSCPSMAPRPVRPVRRFERHVVLHRNG